MQCLAGSGHSSDVYRTSKHTLLLLCLGLPGRAGTWLSSCSCCSSCFPVKLGWHIARCCLHVSSSLVIRPCDSRELYRYQVQQVLIIHVVDTCSGLRSDGSLNDTSKGMLTTLLAGVQVPFNDCTCHLSAPHRQAQCMDRHSCRLSELLWACMLCVPAWSACLDKNLGYDSVMSIPLCYESTWMARPKQLAWHLLRAT
jgi:hypothetical protein